MLGRLHNNKKELAMTEAIASNPASKTPWHIWVVAILTLFWNGSGAYVIWMAQSGAPMDMDPAEIEYYANQALWFQLVTDVALVAPLAAATALCLRNKAAVWLFGMGVAAIAITNTYDVLAGDS